MIDHSHSGSPAPSLTPSDSISTRGSRPSSFHVQSPYHDSHTLHCSTLLSHLNVHPALIWGPERQKIFEEKLAQVTAACGFPLSWVDNPEWIAFCDEFIPAAHVPSCNTLTHQIIPDVTNCFQAQAQAHLKGQLGTLQDNGWTGINHHHLLASMLSVNGKVHPISVDDVSGDCKTAEKLVEHIEQAMGQLEEKWEIELIAIVMDAPGECCKAKKIL